MKTSTPIVVVEIPHRFPAEVYETTRENLVSFAWGKSSFDDQKFESEGFDYAFDVACGDNHSAAYFESIYEALGYYELYGQGHQFLRVLALLEKMAGVAEDREEDEVE
jgi:hypothetical protein